MSIPVVRDRVLQTAVAQTITPVFEAEFEDASFAYRKGRSVNQAVARIERLRNEGYRWVVDADIRTYFDEIDHNLLMAEVEKLIGDRAILALIRQWLKSMVVDGRKRYRLSKGVPQGSPISPMLANLYLDRLDEALLDGGMYLVRYGDDFLVLCKSARKAELALELTEQVLHDLRLEFNPRKTAIVNFERGFRFLGVRFIRSLAFKEKFPDDPLDIGPGGQADAPASKPVDDAQTRPERSRVVRRRRAHVEPVNEMEQAFRDAGISPEQFPSEPALPEPLDPPRDDDLPTGGNPRLKTLYVLGHGLVLGKESERFTIRDKGKIIREIPAIHVDHIMVYGYSQITTQAMHFCLTQRIPVYLLSGGGRYYGVIDSFDTEPVLLHRDQFGTADDPEFCLKLARQFLRGKISNSRLILLRHSRHRDLPRFEQAAAELKRSIAGLDAAATLNQVRGIEGNAARAYFQGIAETVDPAWGFNGRVKQPPTDPVNSLLSYGYTLLFYNIYSLLRCRGLNPHVGYLHPLRAGHPALASDMIEEFRAIIVDAVVLNLVFNRKLTPEDFDLPDQPDRACLLRPEARKHFIRHLEVKLNAPIRHPVSGERLDYRRCMAHQISHLAAVIRGAADNYQPMVLR